MLMKIVLNCKILAILQNHFTNNDKSYNWTSKDDISGSDYHRHAYVIRKAMLLNGLCQVEGETL